MTDAPVTPTPAGAGESAYQPPENLSGKVVSSLKWKLLSQVVRELTRLAVAVLLAHILSPDDWGLAAMALALAIFLEMIPGALSVAIIQLPRITEVERSTVFWTNAALGIALAALGIAVSGTVADFYGEPQVQELFAAVSVGFAITAASIVPEALLTRDLAYRALELRHIVGTLIGGATAIVLALAGAGPWAIVANSLAALVASNVLLWALTPWRPKLVFSRAVLGSMGGEGIRVLGTQLLAHTQMNADRLLVGRYLGADALGNYAFAYQLMITPIGNIAYPVQGVLFPVFATIQADAERLNAAWMRSKRLTVALMAPAFLTLFVVGPDLVTTVFGSKWDRAIPVLELLCLAGVAFSLGTQNWSLLVVRRRTGTLFLVSVMKTAAVVAAIAVGLEWGTRGVAAALGIAYWAIVLPELWLTTRAGLVRFVDGFRATLSPLPFAGIATAGAYLLHRVLVEVDVPAAARVVVVSLALPLLYGALAYVGSAPLRYEAQAAYSWLKARRRAA